jgi:glycosyltransferase involved in cell wall biosynthesis
MRYGRLHIALVGPLPPPAGGIANQTCQLARLLREGGHEVEVVQVNAPYVPAWTGRLRGVRAAVRMPPYLLRLRRAVARAQVVHVMAHSGWAWHLFAAPAVLFAAAAGVPAVVNYRGGGAADFLAREHRLVCPVLRRAAALAVPSGFLREVFARHAFDAAVIANAVDTARFLPRVPAPDPAPHILVARSLEPIYDNASALHALAHVRASRPRARMTVTGQGPEEGALRTLARSLGIADSVHFAGQVEHGDMAALFQQADVLLNPSLVDNMPNCLLEAMASGVPVVSTRAGGVPHMVDDGVNGLLVAPGDAAAMAEAVIGLARDGGRARALAGAGLKTVQRHAWEAIGPQWLSLYTRLAAQRRWKMA